MSITGPVDGEPYKVGVALVDIIAGLFAANAILASLYARKETGKGQRIDISLLDSAVAVLANTASNYLISGDVPARYGNAHPNIVPYQVFRARDRYFALGIGNDPQWQKFCELAQHPEWAEDDRFITNEARVKNRETLVALLDDLFSQREVEEWLSDLEMLGIPAAPINSIDQVFADPQVQAREMKVDVPREGGGSVPQVTSPIKIPTSPSQLLSDPPALGQDTDEILSEILGYDQATIKSLRDSGVV